MQSPHPKLSGKQGLRQVAVDLSRGRFELALNGGDVLSDSRAEYLTLARRIQRPAGETQWLNTNETEPSSDAQEETASADTVTVAGRAVDSAVGASKAIDRANRAIEAVSGGASRITRPIRAVEPVDSRAGRPGTRDSSPSSSTGDPPAASPTSGRARDAARGSSSPAVGTGPADRLDRPVARWVSRAGRPAARWVGRRVDRRAVRRVAGPAARRVDGWVATRAVRRAVR